MGNYVDAVFGAGGILAEAFQGYEPRTGQVALATGIEESIAQGSTLLAEAPTGTGKSIAYSVPASWWAAKDNLDRDGRGLPRLPAVVVTANIALQEQIVGKDLPQLKKLLPWAFTFALMKGRQNYLCLDKFDELGAEKLTITNQEDRRQITEVEAWATRTKTGDLSELPFEPSKNVRRLIVIGQDDCTGKQCAHYDACHAERARAIAKDADIVVTNYHMFFVDLSLRKETDNAAGILPEHKIVIFDEGHKAADIARDFFGFKVTRGGVRAAARLLSAKATPKKEAVEIDRELQRELQDEADRFFAVLRQYARSDEYETRLKDQHPVQSRQIIELLKRAAKLYREAANRPGWSPGRKRELQKASEKAYGYAVAIEAAMTLQGADGGNVFFIEESETNCALVMKPLKVADTLRESLFETDRIRSAIVTSATLTASGRFDFVATELGCEKAEELVAASPFDWSKQCALIVPDRMVDPRGDKFADMVAETMVQTAELADGRMLGLFTSYRVLERAHKLFLDRGWGDRVMRQGEAPRTQLIARLKEEIGTVLLGTESFWAGVDVPGEALSVVVIDRLPFPSPEDPMLDAYESIHGSRTFKDYSMPRAVIALRQGFGRLIRTTADRGAVVVCDRRIVDKSFGRSFVKSLPPVRLTRDLHDVARMLGRPVPERAAAVSGARYR